MRLKPPRPNDVQSSIELGQLSAFIDPGTILFLRKDREVEKYLPYTGLHRKALGHPCVVMDVAQDGNSAMILTMTTFHGALLENFLQHEYWQDYLPIVPTPCNPIYPGIQLRSEIDSKRLRGGYVNIVDRHWVPWDMSRKWGIDPPLTHAHLDKESVDIIFSFLEWATYDPVGEVPLLEDFGTIPLHLRRNRYPPRTSRHQDETDALQRLAALRSRRQLKQASPDDPNEPNSADGSNPLDEECTRHGCITSEGDDSEETEQQLQLQFQQRLNVLLFWIVVGIFLLFVHPNFLLGAITWK